MGAAADMIGAARVGGRAMGLLGVTGARAGQVVLRHLTGRGGQAAANTIAARWGADLCRVLGVAVTRCGQAPAQGSLIVANHRSYVDIGALYAHLDLAAFLAKAEVARWPVLGPATRVGGTLYVDRSSKASRRAARQRLREVLDQGISAVVFPEGTTAAKGTCLPFRPGVFALAAQAGVPVVPVAIEYAEAADAWLGDDTFTRHFGERFRRRRMAVTVSFGPALRGADGDRLRQDAEAFVRAELARLNGTMPNHESEGEPWRVDTPRPTASSTSNAQG